MQYEIYSSVDNKQIRDFVDMHICRYEYEYFGCLLNGLVGLTLEVQIHLEEDA